MSFAAPVQLTSKLLFVLGVAGPVLVEAAAVGADHPPPWLTPTI
jgi:hypothetical protein